MGASATHRPHPAPPVPAGPPPTLVEPEVSVDWTAGPLPRDGITPSRSGTSRLSAQAAAFDPLPGRRAPAPSLNALRAPGFASGVDRAAGGGTFSPSGTFEPSVGGHDPSVGKPREIYCINVRDSARMGTALTPEGFHPDNFGALIGEAVDVTALPGTFSGGEDGEVSSDVQALVTSLAGSLNTGRLTSTTNNNFGSPQRSRALRNIGSVDDTHQFINELHETQALAFEAQDIQFSAVMQQCGYTQEEIEVYLARGFLPYLGRQTYELFRGFFEQVRHTAHTIDTGSDWNSSLAKVMLSYHVNKLVNIRRNARSYRYFVIYVYIHLRDARKNKFMAQSMTSTLWQRTPATTPGVGGGATSCRHCGRQGLGHGAPTCPLRRIPTARATQAFLPPLTAAQAPGLAALVLHRHQLRLA